MRSEVTDEFRITGLGKYNNNEKAITNGFPSNDIKGDATEKSRCKQKLRVVGKCLQTEGAYICSMAFLHRRLPVTQWLPRYSVDDLLRDAIAGFTVGLTVLPQGIAYAVVAGLEPQYGLYSAFMGCFMYFLFGTSKDITIGPTAVMALMTAPYVSSLGADFAVLLSFLSGCIILLMGFLHLGFLVDFISMPVTSGFMSAAAITIASSQVKNLLGLPGSANGFIHAWKNTFTNISHTNLWDMTLGLTTLVILLLAKRMSTFDKKRDVSAMRLPRRIFSQFVKMISLGRNAIVVLAGTVLAYALYVHDVTPFTLTGSVTQGLPPFQLPPFTTNHTNITYNFVEMVEELGSATITIPIIAILESIAIAKSFSKGKILDATQEMIALGMCNIMGSFVSSIPTTGSFTRSAVNHASGVRTPLGGLFTGSLVLLALSVLTSSFYFIPKANLAGLIICAVCSMVEYEAVIMLWRVKKLDLIPLFVTFVSCLLLGLDLGIIVGISVNLIFVLYITARPKIHTEDLTVGGQRILLVRPKNSLIYPAAEYVRELVVSSAAADRFPINVVVVDGCLINAIDSTMAENFKSLIEDLENRKQTVFYWNWKRRPVFALLSLDKELSKYFRFESSLEELVSTEMQADPETVTLLA